MGQDQLVVCKIKAARELSQPLLVGLDSLCKEAHRLGGIARSPFPGSFF